MNNMGTSQDWKRKDLPNDESLGKFIKYLNSFVDFYRDEDCEIIYDGKNASAFIYSINILSDCYPNRVRELMITLKNLENWRRNSVSSGKDKYTSNGRIITDEMRSEIACRMMHNPNDSFLLVVHIPNYNSKEWELSNGQDTYRIESQPLSIKSTFDWMSSHHFPQRCYNWNSKHGENGKGAHPEHKGEKVSRLLCSKEHAEEIMHKAIGMQMYDTLYCYDAEFGKFMEYKAECKFEHLSSTATKRYYHSYHIDNEESIPKRIKEKINILKKELDE